MSLIAAADLSKNFGGGYILENLAFTIEPGDRIGLVGPNGGGKTTLIRILAEQEDATSGTITRKKGMRIGYLPQDAPVPADVTLWQAMLNVFADLRQMEHDLRDLADQLAGPDVGKDVLDRYGVLQHEFEDRGGYDYHTRIETVLMGLSFTKPQFAQPMAQLSGGQRNRALLAGVLLSDPDVLLLDEPTNHLDLDAIEWLEKWLLAFKGAIVVVAHDRFFLDRVAQRIWEISLRKLETYRANYTQYVEQRVERMSSRLKTYESQQEYIAKTQEFIRRNVGAKRVDVAQGRKTRLERFIKDEAIEKPVDLSEISLRFKDVPRSGDVVLRFEDLHIGYVPGKPLLKLDDLQVLRGERVAIIGGNGTGKTTLLRTLLNQLKPLSGKVYKGGGVEYGYLGQTHDNLRPDMTALASVMSVDPKLTTEAARNLLGRMLLSGEDAFKRIDQLSGGQRSRVVLAQLVVQRANCLMLDEPTNHLDVSSQEVLQEVLADFPGTVVFVSHDRYLVRALAQRIWVIEGRDLHPIVGGWREFLRWRSEHVQREEEPPEARAQAEQAKASHRENRQKTNQVQRLQRRQQELEKELHQLENKLKNLGHQISLAGQEGDLDKVHKLGADYQDVDGKVKNLWAQWADVAEDLEREGVGSDQ